MPSRMTSITPSLLSSPLRVPRRGRGVVRVHWWRIFSDRFSVRVIDIRAVRHLVQNGLCVGPEPRDRPEQSAEAKREQAQALDSPELRMVPLFGNLFGEDMDQQEDPD